MNKFRYNEQKKMCFRKGYRYIENSVFLENKFSHAADCGHGLLGVEHSVRPVLIRRIVLFLGALLPETKFLPLVS